MRRTVADGWTGHRGILHSPLWGDFYDSDDEFRALMDELNASIDAMRREANL